MAAIPNGRRAVVSWSGGKDSCLACYWALKEGWHISFLLNMISQEFLRSGGHGIHHELMEKQAAAIGVPIHQPQFTRENYEEVFKAALRQLKGMGGQALVTGDIYLEENREWVERVAREVGMGVVMPLWGKSSMGVVEEFLREGFRAVVVALQADLVPEGFLGRWLDRALLEELVSLGTVDPAGEKGEFHTLVVDGPLFRERLEILETGRVFRDNRWFLDIPRYRLRWKGRGDGGG